MASIGFESMEWIAYAETRRSSQWHYSDVIMSVIAFQNTGISIAYSAVCSGADQSSASQAFVSGIHRWPVNSPHKGPVTRKMVPFEDVIMYTLITTDSTGRCHGAICHYSQWPWSFLNGTTMFVLQYKHWFRVDIKMLPLRRHRTHYDGIVMKLTALFSDQEMVMLYEVTTAHVHDRSFIPALYLRPYNYLKAATPVLIIFLEKNIRVVHHDCSLCNLCYESYPSLLMIMVTSSNGNIFRVTGHLCGEFTGHRWIPTQRPVARSFAVFFDLHLKKTVE